ncbi:GNAT family N-acetyltransferase [Streptomyces sp. PTM05]|uniref:GNAT family N-acetyltransferase n=1 Tax=Streptantibioticus parmotrematis TaxID=2873249 RepID=A0ABS7QX31_9ACTN|nr:GNAT family N-acetyltransferase [Streptantibioticus parmotrematis]
MRSIAVVRGSARCRLLEGQVGREFIRNRWADLAEADGQATPYQSAEWVNGWAGQLTSCSSLVVVVVENATRSPVAAIALRERVDEAGDELRLQLAPLSSPHAEYVRPVGSQAEDEDVIRAIVDQLDVLAAERHIVLPDVPLESALGRHLSRREDWNHVGSSACASVPLPLDMDALSAATRRNHRRRKREWATLEGHVEYRRTSSNEELLYAFPDLARLHRLRWGAAERVVAGTVGEDERTWRGVLNSHSDRMATIATLRVDRDVVAAQLCLLGDRVCYSLVTAMNPGAASLAPGHALLRFLIRDLTKSGFVRFDLGRTLAHQLPYKAQYGPRWTSTGTFVTSTSCSRLGSRDNPPDAFCGRNAILGSPAGLDGP